MKDVAYQLDRAIVTIMTEISEASMVGLVAEIDRLSTDYFYKKIGLSISSPGGSSLALDYYLDALKRFQASGVQISTRALTQANSAAAAMVSLGDGLRKAGRTAMLRYHFHRVPPDEELTAHKAREYQRLLSQIDRKMTWQIAERAFAGYGFEEKTRRPASRPDRSLDDFGEADWRVMHRLAGAEIGTRFDLDEENRKIWLAAVRKRVANDCEQQSGAYGVMSEKTRLRRNACSRSLRR